MGSQSAYNRLITAGNRPLIGRIDLERPLIGIYNSLNGLRVGS